MLVTSTSYIAEFIGTFFFILSIFFSGGNPLIIAGSLAIVIFMIAGISGSHVNPAISFAMFMDGQLKPVELVYYVIAQLAGAVSAYFTYVNLRRV